VEKIFADIYSKKKSLLENSINLFYKDIGLKIYIGCEIEFYLFQSDKVANVKIVNYYINLLKNFFLQKPDIYDIQKELSDGQVEIKISPKDNLTELCELIYFAKQEALKVANANGLYADFSSYPILGQCMSALQFNISVHDNRENKNLLFDLNDDLSRYIIHGMISSINKFLIFYAPKKEDYSRFSFSINKELHSLGKYTSPVNLSFGRNNRTCSVRIANSSINANCKRIEFRPIASDADPYLALSFLVNEIRNSIKNKLFLNYKELYGNSFDLSYNFERIIDNFADSKESFINNAKFSNLIF